MGGGPQDHQRRPPFPRPGAVGGVSDGGGGGGLMCRGHY